MYSCGFFCIYVFFSYKWYICTYCSQLASSLTICFGHVPRQCMQIYLMLFNCPEYSKVQVLQCLISVQTNIWCGCWTNSPSQERGSKVHRSPRKARWTAAPDNPPSHFLSWPHPGSPVMDNKHPSRCLCMTCTSPGRVPEIQGSKRPFRAAIWEKNHCEFKWLFQKLDF